MSFALNNNSLFTSQNVFVLFLRQLSYCLFKSHHALCCSRNVEHIAPVDNEDADDPRDVLKVEEHAVVLALRDTYMPGLDGSDAVMFATLLADLFPDVQVPMIFESYGSQGSKMQMNEQVSNLEEIPVLSKAPAEPSGDNVEGV